MYKALLIFTSIFLFLVSVSVSAQVSTPNLIINEIMPNPIGSDSDYEWIEIKNTSNKTILLNEWELNGNILPEAHISPGEIFLISRNVDKVYEKYSPHARNIQTSFSLSNSGATLTLNNITNSDTSDFIYPSSTEGISFELLEGSCNKIEKHLSSNSIGATNTNCIASTPTPAINPGTEYSNKLTISSVFSNPDSEKEWLEIKNLDNISIDIENWYLEDATSKKHLLPELTIEPNSTERIYPVNLSLNNNGDTIYLYTPNSIQIDMFSYGDSKVNDLFTIYMTNEEANSAIKLAPRNTTAEITKEEGIKRKEIVYQIPKLYKYSDI